MVVGKKIEALCLVPTYGFHSYLVSAHSKAALDSEIITIYVDSEYSKSPPKSKFVLPDFPRVYTF